MNDVIKEIAESSGASLAPVLSGNELIAFEVLRSGEVEVQLADGTRTVIVLRQQHPAAEAFPSAITAEEFITMMAGYAALPIGVRPEGRRFFRRNVITADGTRGIRFSEAGRDV